MRVIDFSDKMKNKLKDRVYFIMNEAKSIITSFSNVFLESICDILDKSYNCHLKIHQKSSKKIKMAVPYNIRNATYKIISHPR